jgi:3-oxoacyl-[acyl-carrier protein] reductase
MNISLENKHAIVCGSTQGIGLAIAEELAALGARCTLIARNEKSLQEATNKLHATEGQKHGYLIADFSDPDSLKKIIEEYMRNEQVHILVNNTGGPPAGPIANAEEQDFLHAFNQHLICNHILAKAVIPSMKAAQYGRIINIISTSVKIPIKNLGVSNTIRGAVASWAKTMANELGQFNITVNNVLPGFTETERLRSMITGIARARKITDEEVASEMRIEIPLKRFGTVAEIASVTAFLATPAASFLTGASIPVDGGRTGSI